MSKESGRPWSVGFQCKLLAGLFPPSAEDGIDPTMEGLGREEPMQGEEASSSNIRALTSSAIGRLASIMAAAAPLPARTFASQADG